MDLNADKYTDIVTIDEDQTRLSFYLFNTKKLVFELWTQLEPAECKKVTNTVVGQSKENVRLFITCLSLAETTQVQVFDLVNGSFVKQATHFAIG